MAQPSTCQGQVLLGRLVFGVVDTCLKILKSAYIDSERFFKILESSETKVSERTIIRELHGNGIKFSTPRKTVMLTKNHVEVL